MDDGNVTPIKPAQSAQTVLVSPLAESFLEACFQAYEARRKDVDARLRLELTQPKGPAMRGVPLEHRHLPQAMPQLTRDQIKARCLEACLRGMLHALTGGHSEYHPPVLPGDGPQNPSGFLG